MKNKLISGVLATAMVLGMNVPAMAAVWEPNENDGYSSEITVNLQPTVMNVKVPTQLPIGVNADGSSSGAVTAHIQNNSAAQVEVTGVRVEAASDWTIKSWNTDWSQVALGTKEFAFKVNNKEVATDGSVDAEFGVINGSGEKLAFTYEGRIAPQNGTGVATLGNVVFTVGWVENSELITFTIDGVAYSAEEGMTWAEWVLSSHNTSGFTSSGDNIWTTGQYTVTYDGSDETRVLDDSEITAGTAYKTYDPWC